MGLLDHPLTPSSMKNKWTSLLRMPMKVTTLEWPRLLHLGKQFKGLVILRVNKQAGPNNTQ
ncbi:hypothetical protein Fmac_030738 [Flemingia macrophylla]|uniref:Uncharacterized protein n=1 Tax=Flemingia macrophylla TaxID=520843 RepID=A0ABD1L019_9FABA